MKKIASVIFCFVLVIAFVNCAVGEEGVEPDVQTYKTYGMNFSPYMDGQNPNKGSQISEEQIRDRLLVISAYTNWVRTFGVTDGLEAIPRIAKEMGLNTAIGVWLSSDLLANETQIQNLIQVAKNGYVDLVIVGSEVLLRGDLTEAELIWYINRVKTALFNVIVTTADTFSMLLDHPAVMNACDVIFANYYPYWEGVDIDYAIANLHEWHQEVVNTTNKEVYVSEVGWPSGGNIIGKAVPSPYNASYHFLNFVSWARANKVKYFYFEAFDEAWKAQYEGPQGKYWGVWDKDGFLKPGMQDVFDGITIPDNWTCILNPGGPGVPFIKFTNVPPRGSYLDVKGRVLHVSTQDYAVAVYIKVRGRWWTKPYFNRPKTDIDCDGVWVCDITTGGVDSEATHIAAYLIPVNYNPPAAGGTSKIPAEIEHNSVDSVIIQR